MSAPKRIWLDWPDANRGDVVYDEPPERDTQPGQTEYVRKDASDAAISAARAEGVREGMLKAADYADNWLATFGQVAIKHTPAQEYACDAVADIADAIRAAAEAQP